MDNLKYVILISVLMLSMTTMAQANDTEFKIEHLTNKYTQEERNLFDRVVNIIAPNGKPIRIFAQKTISNEQILRSAGILTHYLKGGDDSIYKLKMNKIANQMANNKATLILLNGSYDGSNDIDFPGQPLFSGEIQIEGSKAYIDQDYKSHRDASFEEILHLVHDTGIGVDGKYTFKGELPEFQKLIRKGQIVALKSKIWGDMDPDWIEELTHENSLSQEYLASVVDVYYGLWGAWKGNNCGMWGLYKPKTREDLKIKDPNGYEIVQTHFFSPYFKYTARIAPEFKGTFSLKYDKNKGYTNHSQYIKDIKLLGVNDNSVVVNGFNNIITGNKGTNKAYFSGYFSEYNIKEENGYFTVSDSISGRDGSNTLKNIEILSFKDRIFNLKEK